jgi:adenosylcobyric acid synthase
MVLGCTSDAGKSFLAAALCRWFVRRGERVVPFKAQNMSNNAAVCPDGGEIGRAQWLQAKAARLKPEPRMNPILLKPEAESRSQIVVMGRYDPELTRMPWLERRARLWPLITRALDELGGEYDRIVAEGAGSPAEPNLMAYDLVNLAVARHLGAASYLVADIDRGGAFAHLLGTYETLAPEDRPLVRGFILNKFRGDPALLHDAREWLEKRTGVPTVALVPFRQSVLPEEDNFIHRAGDGSGAVRIALVLYPYASNLDEFDPLVYEAGVSVVPARGVADLDGVAAIILPGSKNTGESLASLRETGLAGGIGRAAREGIPVYGVCGGLQMLGREILDPYAVEGRDTEGLGLLGVTTTLAQEKTVRLRSVDCEEGGRVSGYEIHHGVTTALPGARPHLGEGLGWREGNVTGVYLHGIFENTDYRQRFLESLGWRGETMDWQVRLESSLDSVADLVDESGWASDLESLD